MANYVQHTGLFNVQENNTNVEADIEEEKFERVLVDVTAPLLIANQISITTLAQLRGSKFYM